MAGRGKKGKVNLFAALGGVSDSEEEELKREEETKAALQSKQKRQQKKAVKTDLKSLAWGAAGGGGGGKKGKKKKGKGGAASGAAVPSSALAGAIAKAPLPSGGPPAATGGPPPGLPPAASDSDPALAERVEQARLARFEEELKEALWESLADPSAAPSEGTGKAQGQGKGKGRGKGAVKPAKMSLQEFQTGGPGKAVKVSKSKDTAPSFIETEALIRREAEKARMLEVMASNPAAAKPPAAPTGSTADASAPTAPSKTTGATAHSAPSSSAVAAPTAPATAAVQPAPGLPSPALPAAASFSVASVNNLVARGDVASALHLSSNEIVRLSQENTVLRSQLHTALTTLQEASMSDRAQLVAQVKELSNVNRDMGMEVARMHMELQKARTRLHELEGHNSRDPAARVSGGPPGLAPADSLGSKAHQASRNGKRHPQRARAKSGGASGAPAPLSTVPPSSEGFKRGTTSPDGKYIAPGSTGTVAKLMKGDASAAAPPS